MSYPHEIAETKVAQVMEFSGKTNIHFNALWKKNNLLNCKITRRLIFAKKGYLDDCCFEACALGFSETHFFDILSIKKLTICNPEKSVINKAIKNNHFTFVDLKDLR